MKDYLLISILILSVLGINASGPQVNPISTSHFVSDLGEYYSNGVYYFGQGQYYNTTSGYLSPPETSVGCNSAPSYTNSVEPFCINAVLNDRTVEYIYSIVFLNSNLTQTTAKYELGRFPSTTNYQFQVSGDFIITEFLGSVDLDNNFTIMPFQVSTKTLVCTKQDIKSRGEFVSFYTNGTIVLYSIYEPKYNFTFVTESCSSNQNTTSPGPGMYGIPNFFAFNGSSVFVNYFSYNSKQGEGQFVEIGVYNSTNQINFGSKLEVLSFAAYNDTHMFINYINGSVQNFGLFVISPALEFVQILSLNFGFNVPIEASPIIGTNDAQIILGKSDAVITYSINTSRISQVGTLSIPIYLAYGSVTYPSKYGFFVQTPGVPIYFVQSPFSNSFTTSYQDPSDTNQTYTLFVPSATYNYYNTCLLTQFNASSSVAVQTNFSSCPLTLTTGNPIIIKDVKFGSYRTIYVCYRDAYGSLFIVNNAGSSGPFKSFYTYSTVQVSMNLTNGTANFAGTQLSSFVLGRFNIASGAVLQSQNIVGTSLYNYISKVTDRYYLLAFGGNNSCSFAIYDMNEFNRTYMVKSNSVSSFFGVNAFLVFGFSEENPSTFSGLVFSTNSNIYVVNSAGVSTVINPGQNININYMTVLNETSFIVSEYEGNSVDFHAIYQITNWGTAEEGASIHLEEY